MTTTIITLRRAMIFDGERVLARCMDPSNDGLIGIEAMRARAREGLRVAKVKLRWAIDGDYDAARVA